MEQFIVNVGGRVRASTFGGDRNEYFDVSAANSLAAGALQVSAGLDLAALAKARSGETAAAVDARAVALRNAGAPSPRLNNEAS